MESALPPHAGQTRGAPPRGWASPLLFRFTLALVCLAILIDLHIARLIVLIFGGLLFGAVLQLLAGLLVRWARLPYRLALAVTVLLLVGAALLGGWLCSGAVSRESQQLFDQLPDAFHRFEASLGKYAWGARLVRTVNRDVSEMIPSIARDFPTVLEAVGSAIVFLFVGLYVAIEPDIYAGGLLSLIPSRRQPRMRRVLHAVGYSLQWWIIGQSITMSVLGILTGVGLKLIGIPLALPLGILAALLNFIPTFGAILAFIPAVVLAAPMGIHTLVYVLMLWLSAHMLEGYILTPFIQRRTVWLPPVMGISAQLLLGALLGAIGLIFAHPLMTSVMVIVKMLYVEDDLGNPADVPGEPRKTNNTKRPPP